jgi:hypothetical protein
MNRASNEMRAKNFVADVLGAFACRPTVQWLKTDSIKWTTAKEIESKIRKG